MSVIDWNAASRHVGSGERDDCFLIELLGTFFSDGLDHIIAILGAFEASGRGITLFDGKPIDCVVREHAHAIKGSASNVHLKKVSKAAAAIELPLKAASASGGDASPILASFLGNNAQLFDLISEFRSFALFMEHDAASNIEPHDMDFASVLDASALNAFRSATSLTFDNRIQPYAQLLKVTGYTDTRVSTQLARRDSGQPAEIHKSDDKYAVVTDTKHSTTSTSADIAQPETPSLRPQLIVIVGSKNSARVAPSIPAIVYNKSISAGRTMNDAPTGNAQQRTDKVDDRDASCTACCVQ